MIARLALGAALLALAVPAAAQDFAITNATVATGDGSAPVQGATVVVRGGKVVAAGQGVAIPAGVETIDGTGKWVTPGLFAAMTALGLSDADGIGESNDVGARNSPFSAALDVMPALNPASQHVAVARNNGITRASVSPAPASSIFGGQGAVVDLGADPAMIVRPRAFQVVALGEYGAQLAGGSRVSAHAVLRNALREARQYGSDSRITGGGGPRQVSTGDDIPIDSRLIDNNAERDDVLLTRFDAAALVPVVSGQQPLYVGVERASDIRAVLALRSEFPNLKLVLVGVSEGWRVASDIAAAGVPVIADPVDDLPSRFEQLAATQSNIGRMAAAGVKVALGGLSGSTGDQPRNLKQYAGNLVALTRLPGASGLTWAQAFAAITSVPAEISGQGGRAGVLAPGAVGDVVIWDGDPLELSSTAERVFIDGVEQPRDDHQTRLKDRYRDLDDRDQPKAYDW
ncbi:MULTISPECIES: amidohydrolase family protein [Bacteria]|uniref:amidohydrolase family protein n=1 Tax=Bacteria TaxID=2 RepID=UPI00103A3D4B|nr:MULTISPECIES: amidohydrolase family protein [Bacteria]QDM41163.1 amidohydrolase family protein [Altererythrobacter sp. TH136]TCJ41181.1 amidohydrolase [Parafrankia sp. BMG5.11]